VWENLPALNNELELFEALMQKQFSSKKNINSFLDQLSLDIIQSGGKRLRPAMTIAAAMLGDYQREKVLNTALSVELLHTATLVHDDIIDNSVLRRNSPTVYATQGINTAVFKGDYIYVKSMQALAAADLPMKYLTELAKAVEAICVGEVEQFRGRGRLPGFKTYLSRISRKTAVLFAACCAVGGHLSGIPEESVKHAARFGAYYGIAFQIKDDLLDMVENPSRIGKPVGNDLKEGVVTLPVLMAAAKDETLRSEVTSFLTGLKKKNPAQREIRRLLKLVIEADGIQDAQAILDRYIAKAKRYLDKLPESEGKEMLKYILDITF
jgi:heptaprenyl diphosphate synthase